MSPYLFDENDTEIHKLLWNKLDLQNLIVFVGSGLSAQATTDDNKHPPLWKGLLEGMVNWCLKRLLINESCSKNILELINKGYLIEAGQELDDILEKSQLQQCLSETLLCNQANISESHKLIVQIPFTAYITTNYDALIEGAFAMENGKILEKFYGSAHESVFEAYRKKEPFIFKMHGDISDANSLVLGSRSYEKLLYSDHDQCLQTLFMTSSVLFIGFGGSDPNFEKIITNVAMADARRKRHWMLIPSDTFPLLKVRRLWKDKGINVIQYKKDSMHSGLIKFLTFLKTPPPVVLDTSEERGNGKSFEYKKMIEDIE